MFSLLGFINSKFQNLKSIIILMLFLLFGFNYNSNAQVNVSYVWSSFYAVNYTPLTGATTAYALGWDDHVTGAAYQATIPFSFVFDGIAYTNCYISPNGFITFGTTQPASTNYTPISSSQSYDGAISALGVNLKSNVSNSSIVYATEGTAPNREFVVEWKNAVRAGDPSLGNFNFQIRLSETTNYINVVYGACISTASTPITVQVGLRSFDNVYAQQNTNNRNLTNEVFWVTNNTTAGSSNAASLLTTNIAGPTQKLDFLWKPQPPCIKPPLPATNLVFGSITNVAISGNSFTAAASTPKPTGYIVLRSTVNVPPTVADVPDRKFFTSGNTTGIYTVVSNSTGVTFSSSGLTPSTTYYFWVIPYNSKCTGAPYYNLTSILTGSATTCMSATTATAATAITGNGFVANWNAIAGATTYKLDVSTNSSFSTFVSGYNDLNVGNVTTKTVTGLTPAVTYYYRVRASNGGCSVNSNTMSLTTLCGLFPIPYSENFNSTSTGTVPNCSSRIDVNSDSTQWGASTITYSSSPNSLVINKNATMAMDDWFITPGLNLIGGTTYRLSFVYNTGSATNTENLKVFWGDGNTIPDLSNTLIDLSNINNTSFKSTYVDFTPLTSGAYYIGFYGFSMANQSYLAIDDVSVIVSPTCFEPTNLTVSNIATNSATVSWTPPAPEPAQGYEYYYSTDPTVPLSSTTPSGNVGFGINTVDLTGLATSTTYYFWVRGKCSSSDKSIWSSVVSFSAECNPPVVTSITPATRCGYGSVTLGAVPNATSVINWYDSATNGTLLGTGNTYTTPNISTTTSYFAEAKATGAIANTGQTSPVTQGGTIAVQNFDANGYVVFTVFANTTLQSIDIFPQASGQNGQITLRNSSLVNIISYPFVTAGGSGTVAQTIPINYDLLAGQTYNLYLDIAPSSGIAMNSDNAFYPDSSVAASITGNGIDNGVYLGFYNWKFTTECLSARTEVIATITPPPALTLSGSISTICENTSTSLVTVNGYASYDTFVWTPDSDRTGSVASGYTFNPTVTTSYTLQATNSGSGCSTVVSYNVNVLPSPPPTVNITPASATVCKNSIQLLKGTAASNFTVTLLNQDFNGATNDWIVNQTSINGDVDASKWSLRTSPYTYSRPSLTTNFASNDNSKFYLVNSDSQGTDNDLTCKTTLQSPYFSLAGAASATLNFWQYIRYTGGDKFLVQITTNGGGTWTTIAQYFSNQGTSSAFANSGLISLNAFLGNPSVAIRFNYEAGWRYYWAIDNVTITANISSALSWTPATDLYKDAAATIPYVLGDLVNDVYTKPTASINYSAVLTGTNGCKASENVAILVDELTVPGTLGSDQMICGTTPPADLTLTGYSGNIVQWEYADNAAFTVGLTTIPNTTNTLTSVQMGTITSIRYFRVLVKNGICSNAYSNSVYVSYPTTTWNGTTWSNGVPTSSSNVIFTANYNSSGDLYACSVKVNFGTVTINSNHNLIVTNDVAVSASGALIFENNASLVQINNTVNTGNITYKRNTTPVLKYDYTYWSSPVAPQTFTAFSPSTRFDKYYEFNAVTQAWKVLSGSSTMTAGKGYIVRTPDIAPFNTSTRNIFNGLFYGVPNNGDVSVAIVGGVNKMNVIGNPYPSSVSADLFLSDPSNVSILDGTIYLWTHNTPITSNQYSNSDFATYNYSGGVGTGTAAPNSGINNSIPNGKIASGQGFMIRGISSGTAKFKNSMRLIGNNNQFFKMSQNTQNSSVDNLEKNRVWLDIKDDQGSFKQTLVGYIETATNDLDRKFDGDFIETGNPISIYSILDNTNLIIQGRALPFNVNDIVPIGYKVSTANSYTISLSNYDGLFNDQEVYLEDKLLNIVHNLNSKDYVFSSEAGVFDNRFVLRYTNNSLNVKQNVFNENTVIVYKKDLIWNVDSGAMQMLSIEVYDVRGRLLVSKKNIKDTKTTFDAGDTNQVLFVKITSVEGQIVTKKVIN